MDNNQQAGYYKHIPICQLNISGLSSHSETALSNFIFKRGIDIIAIQEIGCDKEIDVNTFPGKSTFSVLSDRGVSISIANSHHPQRLTQLEEEGVGIVYAVATLGNQPIIIASCYCSPDPNSTNGLSKLLSNIQKAWTFSQKSGINGMIVLGDFNARSQQWGDRLQNSRGKLLYEYVSKHSCSLASPPGNTFVTSNGGSIIDLCLAYGSATSALGTSWIDDNDTHELFTGAPIRGHLPVIQHFMHSAPSNTVLNGTRYVFNYDCANWDDWSSCIGDILNGFMQLNNEEESSKVSSNVLYNFFLDTVNKASDMFIPSKQVCKHSKPYWSSNLSELSVILRNAKDLYQYKSTITNKSAFDKAKDTFKNSLIKEKNDWVHKKLENLNTTESMLFWKQYRRIFLSDDENFIGNLQNDNEDQTLCFSDSDKEKLLYETFLSGKHLKDQKFDEKHYSLITKQLKDLVTNDFRVDDQDQQEDPTEDKFDLNAKIATSEVIAAIKAQKISGKSSDGDQFHPKMLKHLNINSCRYLAELYSLCLQSGSWPWTESYITFIKKSDKKTYLDPGSYRPLTLSSYIGKIFERILEHRLKVHCKLYDIIDDAQEGFLPGRNTSRYLYKMLSSLHEVKRRKMTAFILLIDFEKAFDSVPIPCLIIKLYNNGVGGKFLKLIHSFLATRYVKLKVNCFIGPKRKCGLIGLPQGSVLSPLLFIIYIADLLSAKSLPSHLSAFTECYKYADDGSVSVVADSLPECRANMQRVCDYIHAWCKRWRLAINCDQNKTEIIILRTNKSGHVDRSVVPPVYIGDKKLSYVAKSKVLGVTIDDDLSFVQHANLTLRNCWYAWYKISDNTTRKRGFNTATLVLLFKTVILTKLLYAAPVWLYKRMDTFKDFLARSSLKMIGSQFYPPKQLTNVLTGIPPLQLILKILIVKFILKSLSQGDSSSARIIQIEETPNHEYFSQVYDTKLFLLWMFKNRKRTADTPCPTSLRELSLAEVDSACLFYSDKLIKTYQCELWDDMLKNDMAGLINSDPFCIEPLQSTEDLSAIVKTHNILQHPLVARYNSRYQSTNLLDFLHGRCLRFQNFAFSVLKYDKSKFVPLCLECATSPDSIYHKIFECQSYCSNSDIVKLRNELQNIQEFEVNFHLKILFSDDLYTRKIFFSLVQLICKESKFKDEYLVRIEEVNE